jgi:hypothetical protein
MIAEQRCRDAEHGLVGRARKTLSDSGIAAIRNLRVEPDPVGVVLLGQVPLYYYKQLAQELVRSDIEDVTIINRIEVVEPCSRPPM